MNSSVAALSCEEVAQNTVHVNSFAEAVGHIETDLYDVIQRMKNVRPEMLTPEQKVKFDNARQRYLRCLHEYGLQEIPSDQ